MRAPSPLRCVQATASATVGFRLWMDPPDREYEGSLDFKACAAAYAGRRGPAGRVLETIALADATYLRERGQQSWLQINRSRWPPGSWDPFGVLDVVASLPGLVPLHGAPTQRGALQHHAGRLEPGGLGALDDAAPAVVRRLRPRSPGEDGRAAEIDVWLDSRLRIHRVRYMTGSGRLHLDFHDFGRAAGVERPQRFETLDLDALRGALHAGS